MHPSGAAALDLHGWTFPVGERTAVVRTAVFPVRWSDFDTGVVEAALAGHLRLAVLDEHRTCRVLLEAAGEAYGAQLVV